MVGSNVGWAVAEWVADTFRDPALLIVLVAGICALAGFWVASRVAEFASREEAVPVDDLI